MALKMNENTFLGFYKNTIQGYSKAYQRYAIHVMEDQKFASFDAQVKLSSENMIPFVEKERAISSTVTNIHFAPFYEYLEFIKLYKYSVPFFYEFSNDQTLQDILNSKGFECFEPQNFQPNFIIGTSLGEEPPIYFQDKNDLYLKFVLQKSYSNIDMDVINYRFPIIIYINTVMHILEIRYDSTKYDSAFAAESYHLLIQNCIEWLQENLNINLYICNHNNIIPILKDNDDGRVKIYKQMMELSTGGSAELTSSEETDYVLPFIGELRELVSENEDLFERCEDAKNLLLQYLDDKEKTASYPYIYIKWVNPVESESYTVKVTFDYFNSKYTLMQHISGQCKDLGKERMNNAIQYLCESGSFTKGEKI